MNNNKWANKITEWTPREGRRAKVRPRKRWREGVEEVAGRMWMRKAQDREKLRRLWRPSPNSGTTR